MNTYFNRMFKSVLLVLFLILILLTISNYYQHNENIREVNSSFVNIGDERQKQVVNDNKCFVNELSLEANLFLKQMKKEIFNASNAQVLISELSILKTLSFMIQDVNEYDSNLIEFVQSLIVKPSSISEKKINLQSNKKDNDYSQFGQSTYINNSTLKGKRNGFFIESGAFDGESLSNSLFFELNFNWTGILIEPIPYYFNQISFKNRRVFALNACIAKRKPFIAKFRVHNFLSGRENQMDDEFKQRVDAESNKIYEIAYIPCFSINTIMKAVGVKEIDLFSLDIEGGEWDVINNINYQELDIKNFVIEWSANKKTKQLIIDKLLKNGFTLFKDDFIDIYFTKA